MNFDGVSEKIEQTKREIAELEKEISKPKVEVVKPERQLIGQGGYDFIFLFCGFLLGAILMYIWIKSKGFMI